MLLKLYKQSEGSVNPSYLTNTLPGGAGSATAGTQTQWGISAPAIECVVQEVLDVTAPTQIGSSGTVQGTPAAAGKLLVADLVNGAFGALWKLNTVKNQACGAGTFGVVLKPANANNVGNAFATSNGNISSGDKALVATLGPVPAYVTTTVNTTAISAGMALASDGAGNLTYAGASPAVGTVLALAAGNLATSISTPTLTNVYMGGY